MRIGIVGAGQLARMLALAGYPLGHQFLVYDRSTGTPGGQVAPDIVGAFDDPGQLRRFASQVDVVTFDWENVPVASARILAEDVPVWPPPRALEVAQDRVAEKNLFRRLGIGTAPYAAVSTQTDLRRAARRIGLPAVLKTRRMGYDGKGQAWLRDAADLEPAWQQLGGEPLIYEGFVAFGREVSLVSARSRDGDIVHYPLAENHHAQGILSWTRAPYVNEPLRRAAERHMVRVLEALDYTGVLCIEFFVRGRELLANEMAPRVHNSGHWTIEGAVTSQFENHVRAVTGMPLGSTAARGPAVMVNFIGDMPDADALLARPGVHLHDYGKTPRPGRKLGHATFVGRNRRDRDRAWKFLLALTGRR
ncbi:MAG: 5-(carboxyamino)imidazole ribonucleotide synthase [Steroidobacteraceae bacterium]